MAKRKRNEVPVDIRELDTIVDGGRQQPLSEDDAQKLKTAIHAMAEQLMAQQRSSEKTKKLFSQNKQPKPEKQTPAPGHGRNGASAFKSAETINVPHEELKNGDKCPECPKGKVYTQKPRTFVRIIGQAPIQASVYLLDSLRCNLCGQIFTASSPCAGHHKYDETVAAMLGVLKYGTGMPFQRIETLEKHLGVPLPTSTQWELLEDAAEVLKPAYKELVKQAAQAGLIHTDDTGAQIQLLTREPDDKRTGVFTTGLVAVDDDRKMALFYTGVKHAGENLRDLLAQRAGRLNAPIQMSDAASRNSPKLSDGAETVLANCLAHGRRHVVEVVESFPDQCRHILEVLGQVFKVDQDAKTQALCPRERLALHKLRSSPALKELHGWLERQLQEKEVEPNSGLGKAIKYLLTHWRKLTLFTSVAGAPIDNNICERALKKAVLHRKNAYFYRTLNGAEVGDLFMSLIHTCELNDANPFQYLTELLRNDSAVRKNPAAWMPWNYTAHVAAPELATV